MSLSGSARAWFVAAWMCAGALALVALWGAPRWFVVCDGMVREVSEPKGWREWPLANAKTAQLLGPDACPRGDVLRERWFGARWHDNSWLRYDDTRDDFVVAGAPRFEESPRERFFAAFHRDAGWRVAYASQAAAGFAIVIGLSLFSLGLGLVTAARHLRAPSEPAGPAPASGATPYRIAPPAIARVVGGDPPVSEAQSRSAVRALRWAIFAAFLLVVLGLLVRSY